MYLGAIVTSIIEEGKTKFLVCDEFTPQSRILAARLLKISTVNFKWIDFILKYDKIPDYLALFSKVQSHDSIIPIEKDEVGQQQMNNNDSDFPSWFLSRDNFTCESHSVSMILYNEDNLDNHQIMYYSFRGMEEEISNNPVLKKDTSIDTSIITKKRSKFFSYIFKIYNDIFINSENSAEIISSQTLQKDSINSDKIQTDQMSVEIPKYQKFNLPKVNIETLTKIVSFRRSQRLNDKKKNVKNKNSVENDDDEITYQGGVDDDNEGEIIEEDLEFDLDEDDGIDEIFMTKTSSSIFDVRNFAHEKMLRTAIDNDEVLSRKLSNINNKEEIIDSISSSKNLKIIYYDNLEVSKQILANFRQNILASDQDLISFLPTLSQDSIHRKNKVPDSFESSQCTKKNNSLYFNEDSSLNLSNILSNPSLNKPASSIEMILSAADILFPLNDINSTESLPVLNNKNLNFSSSFEKSSKENHTGTTTNMSLEPLSNRPGEVSSDLESLPEIVEVEKKTIDPIEIEDDSTLSEDTIEANSRKITSTLSIPSSNAIYPKTTPIKAVIPPQPPLPSSIQPILTSQSFPNNTFIPTTSTLPTPISSFNSISNISKQQYSISTPSSAVHTPITPATSSQISSNPSSTSSSHSKKKRKVSTPPPRQEPLKFIPNHHLSIALTGFRSKDPSKIKVRESIQKLIDKIKSSPFDFSRPNFFECEQNKNKLPDTVAIRNLFSDKLLLIDKHYNPFDSDVELIDDDSDPTNQPFTHLVVSKNCKGRTLRVLIALAFSLPIIDEDWIYASLEAGYWLPYSNFRYSKYNYYPPIPPFIPVLCDIPDTFKNFLSTNSTSINTIPYKLHADSGENKVLNSSVLHQTNSVSPKKVNFASIPILYYKPQFQYYNGIKSIYPNFFTSHDTRTSKCFRDRVFCILNSSKMALNSIKLLLEAGGAIITNDPFRSDIRFYVMGDINDAKQWIMDSFKSSKPNYLLIKNDDDLIQIAGQNNDPGTLPIKKIKYINSSNSNEDSIYNMNNNVDSIDNNVVDHIINKIATIPHIQIITVKYICNLVEESYCKNQVNKIQLRYALKKSEESISPFDMIIYRNQILINLYNQDPGLSTSKENFELSTASLPNFTIQKDDIRVCSTCGIEHSDFNLSCATCMARKELTLKFLETFSMVTMENNLS